MAINTPNGYSFVGGQLVRDDGTVVPGSQTNSTPSKGTTPEDVAGAQAGGAANMAAWEAQDSADQNLDNVDSFIKGRQDLPSSALAGTIEEISPAAPAAPTPAPEETMKSDYVNKATDTVAGQLGSILNTDSQLMQRVSGSSALRSNQGGMLGTAAAIGAGQGALIDRGLQIATPDAAMYAERSAMDKAFGQQMD